MVLEGGYSMYGKRKQEIGESKYNKDLKVCSNIRIKLISLRKILEEIQQNLFLFGYSKSS